jgi:RHS repeat-associated protein
MVKAFYSRCFFLGVWWLWTLPAALGNVWGLDIPPQWAGWIHPYSEPGTETSASAQNQPTGDEVCTYDAAGNRLSSADAPGTWPYDGNNALVGKGDYTFDYDASGNRILRQLGAEIYRYHYDVLNQLTRIEDRNGQVLAEYGYDLFGRRIWKQVDGVRTWFYYTDEGLAAELDESGAVTRSYGFHPHSFGSSNPLFVKQGEQYYWILNDASGFPVRVVQPDGGVVWAGQHDSFGEVTVDYEALHYPFRFPGQYYDQESDLYYNWHRYYDPDTGRYLSWDPAEDGSNHYLYVENNPTIYVDPDGQKLIWWAFTTFTPQGKALKYAAKFLKAAKKVPGAKKLVNKARKAMKRGRPGSYRPDRTLPRDRHGNPVPDTDAPHTQLGTKGGTKGDYTQAREWGYDRDGKLVPKRDIDFTDHGRPKQHPNPHYHDWEPNETGGTMKRSKNPKPLRCI